MILFSRYPAVAVAVVAAVLVASCQSESEKGTASMRTMAYADASRTVEDYARDVIAVVGPDVRPTNESDGNPSRCEGRDGRLSGDDKYSILYMFNVVVAPNEQDAALTRIRDHLVARGFTIDRTDASAVQVTPGTTIRVTHPEDGYQIFAMSTMSPEHLAIWVSTPCYATPGSQPPWTAGITPGPSTTSK